MTYVGGPVGRLNPVTTQPMLDAEAAPVASRRGVLGMLAGAFAAASAPAIGASTSLPGASNVVAFPGQTAEPEPAPEGAPLSKLLDYFKAYQDKKFAEQKELQQSRKYYHSVQWTAEEVKKLNERNQPVITVNRIQRKIDSIVGLVERLRQDPKAFPRSEKHAQGAFLASASLRYVFDATSWPLMKAQVAHDVALALGGIEWQLEQVSEGSFDAIPAVVAPENFFYDPRSVKPDFSDARFMGESKWMDLDAAIELFPDQEDELKSAMDMQEADDGRGQRDWEKLWYDTRLERVKIVECWYRYKSDWWVAIYIKDLKLVDAQSPFHDDHGRDKGERGRTIHKYNMVSNGIDHEGDRYGFVRNLKGAQDEINHRRSKLLHMINVNQWKIGQSGVDDIEKFRREAAKPDGILETRDNADVEKVEQQAQMQGQAELLQEAKNEIENFGPNPALIGQGLQAKSGRAIALLQQAGIAELGPYIIRMRDWQLRCYQTAWWIITEYWQDERYIRLTDDPEELQFLPVNQQVMTEVGPRIANAIGQLQVDIILDEGPDTITLQQEIEEQVSGMVDKGYLPPAAFFAVNQSIPPEIKAKLEKIMQPPPEAQQAQAQAAELEMAGAQADVEAKQAKAAKDKADGIAKLASIGHSREKIGLEQQRVALDTVETEADLHLRAFDGAVKAYRGDAGGDGAR